jgi:aminoglycoside phosphotransferase (APT) family kinase protein
VLPEAIIRYLATVRATCAAVVQAPDDSLSRRRLEQVCQVLNALISDAKVAPRLEARAVDRYRDLLLSHRESLTPQAVEEYASARALVAKLIAAPDTMLDARGIDFCRRAVQIEHEFLQNGEQARRLESQPALGANEPARSEIPDAAVLSEYLSGVFAAPAEVSEIATVSLGYSKATFLLGIRSSAAVPAALVVRMDRPFNFLGTTVIDEYPILQVLYDNGVSVPRPYALERTGGVLGQPFLVVSRVYGRNIGSHFHFPAPNPALCATIGAKLAQIHGVPAAQFGPGLRGTAQPAAEQIAAEIERYHADWSALEMASPTMEAAFQWIKRHAGDAVGPRSLVHGDFSLSNLLISDADDVASILDWEFAQLGPPAADLGWFFIAAGHLASWEEFLAAYRAAGGPVPAKKQLDLFVLWGMVRLAVMNFQVESGFERGRMHDIKHAYAAVSFARECVLRVGAYLSELLAAEESAA